MLILLLAPQGVYMNTNLRKTPSTVPKMKRIASIDFLRGLSIWMMVFLHVFNHKYDWDWVSVVGIENIFQYTNIFFAIFIFFSGFFGNWVGIFVLLSGVVNTFSFIKKTSKGFTPSRAFIKQIITGFGILIAGFISESFGYYGYFGSVFQSGNVFQASTWTDSSLVERIWKNIFHMEALQIIGFCMILTAVLVYFLNRNGGYQKVKRNLLITLGILVVVIISTPFMWLAADKIFQVWPDVGVQESNASLVTYLMMMLTGDYYPIFPFMITSLVGVCFGILLAMEKPPKRMPLIGLLTMIVLGIIGAVSITFMPFDISFNRPTFPFFFMLLASQVGLFTLMLWLVEYRGKSQKFGNNIIVKYFRNWGTIALTIFVLQIYHLVPYAAMNPAFTSVNLLNGKFPQNQEGWVFLLAFITILFFDLLIWLWAQINFLFSFEWFIIHLNNIGSKERISQRLKFKKIMSEVEWINFKELSEN